MTEETREYIIKCSNMVDFINKKYPNGAEIMNEAANKATRAHRLYNEYMMMIQNRSDSLVEYINTRLSGRSYIASLSSVSKEYQLKTQIRQKSCILFKEPFVIPEGKNLGYSLIMNAHQLEYSDEALAHILRYLEYKKDPDSTILAEASELYEQKKYKYQRTINEKEQNIKGLQDKLETLNTENPEHVLKVSKRENKGKSFNYNSIIDKLFHRDTLNYLQQRDEISASISSQQDSLRMLKIEYTNFINNTPAYMMSYKSAVREDYEKIKAMRSVKKLATQYANEIKNFYKRHYEISLVKKNKINTEYYYPKEFKDHLDSKRQAALDIVEMIRSGPEEFKELVREDKPHLLPPELRKNWDSIIAYSYRTNFNYY